MKAEDLVKPGAVVVGIAAAAALGFAAGYLVAKDPALLRRLMRSLAGGVERLRLERRPRSRLGRRRGGSGWPADGEGVG
jgi:hypothetical protein